MVFDHDPEDFKPGGLGCHEALHMASFLTEAVNEQLVEHPAIVQNEEWQKLAIAAREALAKLYNKIGEAHL